MFHSLDKVVAPGVMPDKAPLAPQSELCCMPPSTLALI